jgi:NAD+ kinase
MTGLKVLLYGHNKREILPLIQDLGMRPVEADPDVVVSYGGDGTLLGAERDWPGLPKVALRDSKRCLTCSHESNGAILSHLAQGKLKRTEFIKLQAEARGLSLVCINDINLNKVHVNAGVRYRVWIDEERYAPDEIVGDGLVVSTPFGSSAYYRSITHSVFRVGIGLAFNNTTEPINHLVIPEGSFIRVEITRGPAYLAADNDPRIMSVEKGDVIEIRQSAEKAVILAFDRIKYPADQFIFHEKAAGA